MKRSGFVPAYKELRGLEGQGADDCCVVCATNWYNCYTWSSPTRWKHVYVVWFDDAPSFQKPLNWMVSVRAARAFPRPLASQRAHGRDLLCECLYQEEKLHGFCQLDTNLCTPRKRETQPRSYFHQTGLSVGCGAFSLLLTGVGNCSPLWGVPALGRRA